MEKNLVLLGKIQPELSNLLEKLKENEEYTIYTIDNIPEYDQLIGFVENVITITSDFKLTQEYVQICKQHIQRDDCLNLCIGPKLIPSHIVKKVVAQGLNYCLQFEECEEGLKEAMEAFYAGYGFVIQEKMDQVIEKKNVSFEFEYQKKQPQAKEKENTVQRVEKLALFDEPPKDLLKTIHEHHPSVGSYLKKKSIDQFVEVAKSQSLKKIKFVPFVPNLSRKKIDKMIDFTNDKEKDDKKIFQEALPSKKEREKFVSVDQELQRKKLGNLQSMVIQNKKNHKFVEADIDKKSRSKFTEQNADLNKKNISFISVSPSLDKKNNTRDDQRPDLDLKRKKFIESEKEKNSHEKLKESEADASKKDPPLPTQEKDKKPREKFLELEKEGDLNKTPFIEQSNDQFKKDKFIEYEVDKKLASKQNQIVSKNSKTLNFVNESKAHEKHQHELDYASLFKSKENVFNFDIEKILEDNKDLDDLTKSLLQESPEKAAKIIDPVEIYHTGESYKLEFLIFISENIITQKLPLEKQFNFLDHLFFKKYQTQVAVYEIKENLLSPLFNPHNINLKDSLRDITVPYWEDETFQQDENYFYFPFYIDEVHYGGMVLKTSNKLTSNFEALLMLFRCYFYEKL